MTPPPDTEATRVAELARIDSARKRMERRIRAIEGDLLRIEEARKLAGMATWIVPVAAAAKRGSKSLTFTDWSEGEAREVTLPLNPAKSPREQVDDLFKRARRLRGGKPIAQSRLAEARKELVRLETERASVISAEHVVEGGVVRSQPVKAKKARPAPTPPYRAFDLASGRVLVGRNAKHNDALTFQVAKPYHLWLHAKGVAGAHVVVPLPRDRVCSSELLVDAAHLAAHFSDARGEPIVDVTHVPRKYVRKPRGAAPGLVTVEREKVLVLRVDEKRLARLLASESLTMDSK